MLSHPLLVEAIENEFVPVAVHNNKSGRDAEILKRYQVPAWNFPGVRFVDARGKDLIARRDRVWSMPGIAARMRSRTREGQRFPTQIRSRCSERRRRHQAEPVESAIPSLVSLAIRVVGLERVRAAVPGHL